MMLERFADLLAVSAVCGLLALALLLLAPRLGRRYHAQGLRWIWLLLAARLLLPFQIALPDAPLAVRLPAESAQAPAAAPLLLEPAAQPQLTLPPAVADGSPALQPELPQLAVWRALPEFALRPEAAAAAQPWQRLSLMHSLALLWLCGLLLFLIWQTACSLHFRRHVLRWSRPLDNAAVIAQADAICRELAIRRPPAFYESARIDSPMLTGLLRPRLLLPSSIADDAALALVLRHELLHHQRGDIACKLLLLAANALHWFNPAVWLLRRAANHQLELACDEAVITGREAGERRAYAEAILNAAPRRALPAAALSSHFSSGKALLRRRLQGIADSRNKKRARLPLACFCLLLLLSGLLVACETAPLPEPPPTESTSPTESNAAHDTLAESLAALGVTGGAQYTADEVAVYPLTDGYILPAPDKKQFLAVHGEFQEDGLLVERCAFYLADGSLLDNLTLDVSGLIPADIGQYQSPWSPNGSHAVFPTYMPADDGKFELALCLYDAASGRLRRIPVAGQLQDAAAKTGYSLPSLDGLGVGMLWPLDTLRWAYDEASFFWTIAAAADVTGGTAPAAHTFEFDQNDSLVFVEYNAPAAEAGDGPIFVAIDLTKQVLTESGQKKFLSWPLGTEAGTVTSSYGWRSRGWHSGIDIATPVGTEIYAAAAGTISHAGPEEPETGYGNLVKIDHGDGMETYYAHCDEIFVAVDDTVEQGQLIASTGMTGHATGPQLHLELRIDGVAYDPLEYLIEREGSDTVSRYLAFLGRETEADRAMRQFFGNALAISETLVEEEGLTPGAFIRNLEAGRYRYTPLGDAALTTTLPLAAEQDGEKDSLIILRPQIFHVETADSAVKAFAVTASAAYTYDGAAEAPALETPEIEVMAITLRPAEADGADGSAWLLAQAEIIRSQQGRTVRRPTYPDAEEEISGLSRTSRLQWQSWLPSAAKAEMEEVLTAYI